MLYIKRKATKLLKSRVLYATQVLFVCYIMFSLNNGCTDEKRYHNVKTIEKSVLMVPSNITNRTMSMAAVMENQPDNRRKGLIVDWWSDMCFQRVSWGPLWHPLFPQYPHYSDTVSKTCDDKRIMGNSYRRIYGFLFTKEGNAEYDFKLSSRDGAEVLIVDTGLLLSTKLQLDMINLDNKETVLYLKLTESLMNKQDTEMLENELFYVEEKKITLQSHRIYFIEILQGGRGFAKYNLQWRRTIQKGYETISHENLLHVNGMAGKESLLKKKHGIIPKYKIDENENRILSFNKYSAIKSLREIEGSAFQCHEAPLLKEVEIKKLFDGKKQMDETKMYPKQWFDTTIWDPTLLLDKKNASVIADNVFKKLLEIHNKNLERYDLVHVQFNEDKRDIDKAYKQNNYFIELDIKFKNDNTGKVYRASHFVRQLPSGKICFMTDHQGKSKVQINLLTPIKNQRPWLLYLIEMLEKLTGEVNEFNVNLIVIDYNSKDGNYSDILKSSKLRYKYFNPFPKGEKFSKVKALNYGINSVKDPNSIIFVLDLHLQLPKHIFDRIRKLTIQGRTAYCPILVYLSCGQHEQYFGSTKQYPAGFWAATGTGMMAMYKSDWDKCGGFNENKFNTKWGKEDWEMVDRIIAKGIRIIHIRMPRFYHIHHSKSHMWEENIN